MATVDSITFKGNPVNVGGAGSVSVGDSAPDFTVMKSLTEPLKLSDLQGKKVLIAAVPSLDTGVCSTESQRFNQEAANLGDDVVVLVVSRDLPFAQGRWCQANSAENIVTASDYKEREFGDKYGVEMTDLGLLARSVFVVGKDGKIVYAEVVPEMTSEPNYEKALEAVKQA